MVRTPEKKKHKPKKAIKDSLIENKLHSRSAKNPVRYSERSIPHRLPMQARVRKIDSEIQQAKTLVIDSEDYVSHSIAMMFYERKRLAHKRKVDYVV